LHAYTITHAIEDRNVLRFHIDYFKPDRKGIKIAGDRVQKRKVVETILEKHEAATANRRFNALLATASINDAIEYHDLFEAIQAERRAVDPDFVPLNVAAVFSPPAEGSKDVKQMQEDLPQERADNTVEPNKKKEALKVIIADYNDRFGTNHSINEFDLYYQDVQKRIKDQQFSNQDLPHKHKIDITIVVDMLLTGFDSKYLNTLYVDKNLKYHGLIQAFSRTNRVLNDTKPYGSILDFRQQQAAVEDAITLFSGESSKPPKEIWLADTAPVAIDKLKAAVETLDDFMQSQDLTCAPEEVANLKGDAARSQFIKLFKEVQRLNAQLEQYTDLSSEDKATIDGVMSKEQLQGFRGVYLDTAQRLKSQQEAGTEKTTEDVDQLDFELVLFASAVVDYDYIMNLIANYSQQQPGKQKMTRAQLIGLIQSDAKFLDDREEIATYIGTLTEGEGLTEKAIRSGFEKFKAEKNAKVLSAIADKHELDVAALQAFVNSILRRMIFDGEALSNLLAPLDLGWKARTQKELALMEDLIPLLQKRAHGSEIAGLGAYEQ
jgi:type I restriction enzyme R subunit